MLKVTDRPFDPDTVGVKLKVCVATTPAGGVPLIVSFCAVFEELDHAGDIVSKPALAAQIMIIIR
jgi:hypothetical protein